LTLWGRRQECEALDRLFADVRPGRRRALSSRPVLLVAEAASSFVAALLTQTFRVAAHAHGQQLGARPSSASEADT
jgi:hypothetical protein